MDIIKKIWKMIEGQSKKKLIENTAIVIIIGIIIIIAGSTIFSGKSDKPENEQQNTVNTSGGSQLTISANDEIETKLRSLLAQVQGVGKVDVMITYSSTKENVPAYDIKKNQSSTEEKDSEGGTRSISQEEYDSTMVYEDSTAGKFPVILKEIEPEVKGVLVVAEGADSVEVRERILNAVKVVLDIPIHKVQVVQRKK